MKRYKKTYSLSEDTIKAIERIADNEQRTQSSVVDIAVQELDKQKKKTKK